MSDREWENLEIIETFGEEDVYRAFAAPAAPPTDPPAEGTADSVDVGTEPRRRPGLSGIRWAVVAAVLLTAVACSLAGFAVGRHTQHPMASYTSINPSAEVTPTPDPSIVFAQQDQGPCDRLAATTDEIVATSPAMRAMHRHFPTFQVSSLSTSRYDDNDQVCHISLQGVDSSGVTATVDISYSGVDQDSVSSGASNFQGQYQQSYDYSSTAHNYEVTVSMSSLNKAILPSAARLAAFSKDPLLYGN
ncbi:hypothetical protein SAMN05444157_0093 [Frankineae bacterium MT45]|nr:hypothetical protein SAMN05444157_0093 [Frankineae bacterium MT45]